MPDETLKQIDRCPATRFESAHVPLVMPTGRGLELMQSTAWREDNAEGVRHVEIRLCRNCGLAYGLWTPALEEEPLPE